MTLPLPSELADLSGRLAQTVSLKTAKINQANGVNGVAFNRKRFLPAAVERMPDRRYKSCCVGTTGRNVHLSQPSRDARNGLMHLVSRTGIGKADKCAAVNRIE